MNTKKYLIACIVFSLCSVAAASSGESSNGNILKIIVEGDTIIMSIDTKGVESKKIIICEQDLDFCISGNNTDELPFQIRDELIITSDKIIIDGVEYSNEEINRLNYSSKLDDSFTFKAKLPYKDFEFARKKEVDVSRDDSDDRITFDKLIIRSGEVIYGDVVSITGDIKIYGKVFGDIVSVFGDVIMYEGSFAGGDISAPFGEIIKRGAVTIQGKSLPKIKHHKHTLVTDLDLSLRYNRVEGLTVLSGIHYSDENGELPDININTGYAFSLKKWDFDIGFQQEFGDNWSFYYGGNLYQGAVTSDEWIFTESENSIAVLFFKEDFHDFYFRKGLKGFFGQNFGEHAYAQVEFTAQTNESLTKNTNKALFGSKKNFRENYSTVADNSVLLESINGDLRMLGLRFNWDNRDNEIWPTSGQYAALLWQSAGDGLLTDLGGNHSYDIVNAEFSHNQNLTRKQHFSVWFKGGYSDQQLPLDRWMFLGGVGSLRGFDYKEFAGNRFVLVNLDYYFDFSDGFAVSLFADAGKTGFSEREFNDMKLKSDIGLGVIFDQHLRINIAQRLDDTGEGPVVMGRFNVHF